MTSLKAKFLPCISLKQTIYASKLIQRIELKNETKLRSLIHQYQSRSELQFWTQVSFKFWDKRFQWYQSRTGEQIAIELTKFHVILVMFWSEKQNYEQIFG